MLKIIEKKLLETFKGRDIFSREELFDFYKGFEPNLKEATFAWRIYNLKNKGIIKSVQRGYYTISNKSEFNPHVSKDIIKLANTISESFEDVKYCIWDTEWVNEFAQHQSSKRIIIIEIEKDFVESLYYELKDYSRFDYYLNPDKKIIDFYISESKNPVVIKKLITRSPVSKRIDNRTKYYVPFLEKLLVDLFTDNKLLYFYQGAELIHIYKNAVKNYVIDYTKLFSYAKRREREEDIKQFMKNNMVNLVKGIIE